jgi:hypothetical protein
VLAACGEPPDETPLGRDFAALAAKPELATKVKVQHTLISFVGAKRGSEAKRDFAQAVTLAEELLAKARAGADFAAMKRQYCYDAPEGTFVLDADNRDKDYVQHFSTVAFRLAVGEVGIAPYHRSKSPYGFHLIKRLE